MIFFAKLFSLLPFGNLFTGIGGKILLVVGVIAVLGYLVYSYRSSIEDAVLNRIAAKQNEEIIEQLKKDAERQQKLFEETIRLNQETQRKQTELQNQLNQIVRNTQGMLDEPVGELLTETFRELSKIQNPPPIPVPRPVTGNPSIDAFVGAKKHD